MSINWDNLPPCDQPTVGPNGEPLLIISPCQDTGYWPPSTPDTPSNEVPVVGALPLLLIGLVMLGLSRRV